MSVVMGDREYGYGGGGVRVGGEEERMVEAMATTANLVQIITLTMGDTAHHCAIPATEIVVFPFGLRFEHLLLGELCDS